MFMSDAAGIDTELSPVCRQERFEAMVQAWAAGNIDEVTPLISVLRSHTSRISPTLASSNPRTPPPQNKNQKATPETLKTKPYTPKAKPQTLYTTREQVGATFRRDGIGLRQPAVRCGRVRYLEVHGQLHVGL